MVFSSEFTVMLCLPALGLPEESWVPPILDSTLLSLMVTPGLLLLRRVTIQIQNTVARLQLEVEERKRAEEALATHQSQLEETVRERTAKLKALHYTLASKNQALISAGARLRAILDGAADAIITIDERGMIQVFNAEAERMFGYRGDEVVGKNVKMLMPARPADKHNGFLRTYLETGVKTIIGNPQEMVGRRKDGTEIPVDLRISEVRHDGPRFFTGVLRDITQRKANEERMRFLIQALDSAGECIILADRTGVIQYVNPSFTALTGYTAEEAIGSKPSILSSGRHTRAFYARMWKTVLDGSAWSGELTNRRKNGSLIDVHMTISPVIDDTGRAKGFVAVQTDVTHRKRAEQLVRSHNERLESMVAEKTAELRRALSEAQAANQQLTAAKRMAEVANQTKSQFLANMSHELRTPLNGILGFSRLLIANADEGDEKDRQEWLQTVQASAQHLLKLINDILDLSKIEAGKLEVELVRCSPHQIIADVASLVHGSALEKGLNLELDYISPIPSTIMTDPTRLRQLLSNLTSNAIKFTDQGEIRITTYLKQDDAHPLLVIEVADTGSGIPPDKLEAIFDPFVQADVSITRRFGGTGLGLAISARIAEQLGGGLTVASTEHEGSVFTLTIGTGPLDGITMLDEPIEVFMTPASSRVDASSIPRLAGRVLLVEDGVTNRKLIDLVLRRAGATVTVAEHGGVGVERVLEARRQGHPFDIILMDMQMPVMDGYTATRTLRDEGITTPIIALTANAMRGDEERCKVAGCTSYLSKPVDMDELVRTTARLLGVEEDVAVVGPAIPQEHVASTQPLTCSLPINDPEFREIAEEFAAQLSSRLESMRSAWAQRDLKTLVQLAHWLKGAGGTAGFSAFTAPAAELERWSREECLDEVEVAIADIARLLEAIELPSSDVMESSNPC
ncbi:MAG: PAS domain S-box protein [Phycisphaerae bacterium]